MTKIYNKLVAKCIESDSFALGFACTGIALMVLIAII